MAQRCADPSLQLREHTQPSRPFSYQIPPDGPRMANSSIDTPEQTVFRTNARRLHTNVSARTTPAIYSQSRFSYMLTPIEDAPQIWPPMPRHEISRHTTNHESIIPPLPPIPASDSARLPVEQEIETGRWTHQTLVPADQHTTFVAPFIENAVFPPHLSSTYAIQHFHTPASQPSASTPAAAQTNQDRCAAVLSSNAISDGREQNHYMAVQPRPLLIFDPVPQSTAKEQSDARPLADATLDNIRPLLSAQPVSLQPEHSSPTTSPPNTYSPFTPTPYSTQPLFSPFSPSGPNGAIRHHTPGQISHPNMHSPSSTSHHWRNPLCGFTSLLPLGLACPCILYSRTQHRLSQRSRHADPTDMLGHETCNGHCAVWALACGLQGLLTRLLSARVRRAYGIEGGWGTDLVKGCCCCWCALVQGEREVKGREEEKRMWAVPGRGWMGGEGAYTRVDGMRYQNGEGME